jgi:WhiB family redox-sensing transcriptional regulator
MSGRVVPSIEVDGFAVGGRHGRQLERLAEADRRSESDRLRFLVAGLANAQVGELRAMLAEREQRDGQMSGAVAVNAPLLMDLFVAEPTGWHEQALCAQTDPEAFFPEKSGSTREAKRICSRCEVRSECLDYALGHDERYGVWGGLSERERRRLKRPGR